MPPTLLSSVLAYSHFAEYDRSLGMRICFTNMQSKDRSCLDRHVTDNMWAMCMIGLPLLVPCAF